jgi:ferritin-like metal-binding protein YciE
MAFETMQDLLIHQLQDIYSAEQMLTKALPKMQEKASTEELATAFRDHLAET